MIQRLSLPLCIALSLMGAGCVMYKEPPPARSVEYGTFSCDGSYQFVALFADDGSQVALTMDRGRTRMLYRNASGLYSDGTYSLQGSLTTPVTVFEEGVPIMRNCAPVTTQKQYYRKDEKFRAFDIHRDLD